MKKIFSMKVAAFCIAIAVCFTLMSFSNNEGSINYGSAKQTVQQEFTKSSNESTQITRALVNAARVIVNAVVEVSMEYTPELVHVATHLAAVQPKTSNQFSDINLTISQKIKSLD
ncbi:MAG: hypothetical protein KA319_11835 [Ferruginibacter sp.]|nr:hypothetical protein [Ferruginibacter sp.]